MKHRKIATLLTATVTAATLTVPALAANFNDLDGHWGASAIQRWAGYGIVQGSGGAFNPNRSMTRGELAAVIARVLDLKETTENPFSDLDENAWYADAVLKCAAAGILLGDGGTARPDAPVTRQEASVLIGRALKVQPAEGDTSFADNELMADWAAGYIKALSDRGMLNGVGGNQMAPLADINRSSVMALLDQSVVTYVNESGATVQASKDGITVVAAPNVTLTGEADDILVAPGAEGGSLTLNGVSVSGTLTIAAPDAAVSLEGSAQAEAVVIEEGAQQSQLVVGDSAKAGRVALHAGSSSVTVSGSVQTVEVAATAADAVITAHEGGSVKQVENAAHGVTVTGSGKVEQVSTSGNNTTVETSGTKVDAAEGTTGTTAGGTPVEGGQSTTTPGSPEPPSSGGGSGGGGGVETPSYTTVSSEEELKSALESSTHIRLGDDIALGSETTVVPIRFEQGAQRTWEGTISAQLFVASGKTVVLDLAGFTITTEAEEGYLFFNQGNLTIDANGGSVVAADTLNEGAEWPRAIANQEGTLVLNGGTYKGKNAVVTNSLPYKTVGEEGSAEGDEITCKSASTTIQDAVIEGDAAGVVGFANSTVTLKNTTVSAHGHALLASGGTEDVSFLMTGGSLTSADGTAVYFPTGKQLVLDGTSVTAAGSGLEVFGGAVELKNGTSISAGSKDSGSYAESVTASGEEAFAEGSALLMGYRKGFVASSGLTVTVDASVTLASTRGHSIRLVDSYHDSTYDAAQGAASITLNLPETLPESWTAASEKDVVHYDITETYKGTVSIPSGALIKAQMAAFVATLEHEHVTIQPVEESENEYNMTFTSLEISGTGAVSALAKTPGLTKLTVTAGAEDEDPTEYTGPESGPDFKSAVLAKFPQSNGESVTLTITFTAFQHDTEIVFHVTNEVAED